MKNWRITRVLMSMADTFLARRVTRSAAELAYCMVMALFPAIICIYDLLALILRDPAAVLRIVETLVLPRETQALVSDFLTYVSGNTSEVMFFAALLVMITSASAAFRAMAAIVGEIHGGKRFGIVRSDRERGLFRGVSAGAVPVHPAHADRQALSALGSMRCCRM